MRALTLALLLAAVTCASCGDSGVSPSDTGNGTLNLFLTDTPFSDATALLVTFSEASAHLAGDGGSARISVGDARSVMRTCDIKRLQDAQDLLGVGTLPAGHYTQLRIVVAGAALYFDNVSTGPPCAGTIQAPAGRRSVVDLSSGEVRLNQEFDIVAGANAVIVLDFDGENSVTDMGNGRYRMTPLLSVVSVN
jgi:uncharacterized protein DUF4382